MQYVPVVWPVKNWTKNPNKVKAKIIPKTSPTQEQGNKTKQKKPETNKKKKNQTNKKHKNSIPAMLLCVSVLYISTEMKGWGGK